MTLPSYIQRLRRHVGHELLLIPSVSILVFDAQRRVLLVKHAEGQVWVTPGGSLEPNESPADAAVREMWEETRLLVEPVRVLGVYGGPDFQITYASGDQVTYLMTVFECRLVQGEMQPDGIEILDLAYVAQSDLASYELAPWARAILPDLFHPRAEARFRPASWKPPL
jgi:8-oxo-dGTP pyrophosphatase MutT (NUDIX family)